MATAHDSKSHQEVEPIFPSILDHKTCFGHGDIDKFDANRNLKTSWALELITPAVLLLPEQTWICLAVDELQMAKSHLLPHLTPG